jgi:hypothetical protein
MRVTIPIAELDRRPALVRNDKNGGTTMVNAKHIDDVGASAVGLGEFRRAATGMTASIRDAALVVMALLWQCRPVARSNSNNITAPAKIATK